MSDCESGECQACGQGSFSGFPLSPCSRCGRLVCPDCTNYPGPDLTGPCVECVEKAEGGGEGGGT